MADARRAIFAALAAARPVAVDRPPRAVCAQLDGDRIERFRAAVEAAGGDLVDARSNGLGAALASLPGFGSAIHVYSAVPDASHRGAAIGAINPSELAGLDFALIRGAIGVAESGAVWHEPADGLERAAVLLAEHLLITLDAGALVPLLHDAYARIDMDRVGFGWFLSGPSKTADIEQALVLGAHGAMRTSVLLV